MNWVDVVGFQHEPAHTGVLAWLLRDHPRTEARRAVAATLTGEPVDEIWDVCLETKAGGKGVADLVFGARIGGHERYVAVETKVDSLWRPEQLEDEVAEGDLGVLLALGCQDLALDDADLVDHPQWRLSGLKNWSAVLESAARFGSLPTAISEYRRALAQERQSHGVARRLAALGLLPKGGGLSAGRGPKLAQWAYFGQVLDACPRGRRGEWIRGALVSGPMLTWWNDDGTDDLVTMLQFMGHGSDGRELAVKVEARTGRWRQALGEFVFEGLSRLRVGLEPPLRAPSLNARSCTVLRHPLEGVRPRGASRLAQRLARRLAEVSQSAFDEVRRL